MQVKIGEQYLNQDDLLPLLAKYQLLHRLAQDIILDQAIAATDETLCSVEETEKAINQLIQQLQLQSDTELQTWLQGQGLKSEQLAEIATRPLRIEKFKQRRWGDNVEAYFLERKTQLDRIVYSLIRTNDLGIAQELYFRIIDDAGTFSELAKTYSQGSEAQTGGLVGPVEMSTPHPQITAILKISQPGELKPPVRIGEWYVLLRLERFLPAQLDDVMRQRLINEQFEQWLRQEIKTQLIVQFPENTDQVNSLSIFSPHASSVNGFNAVTSDNFLQNYG